MSSKLLRVVVSSIFLANKFGNFLNMKLVLSLKFEVKLFLVRYLFLHIFNLFKANNRFHFAIFRRLPSLLFPLKPPQNHHIYDFKRPYNIIIDHKLVNDFVKFRVELYC